MKATVAPKEDLLSLPSPSDVAEINALVTRNNAVTAWHNSYARSSKPDDVPDVTIDPIVTPQLLEVKQGKQGSIAVYGKIRAERQVDRWNLLTQMEFPELGKPLSAFGGSKSDYIIKGTPAAEAMLQKLRATVEANEAKEKELLANVERATKEKAEKLEAMKKAQRDALVAASAVGTRYVGTYSTDRKTEKVSVEFEKNELNGAILVFKVASVAYPSEWVRYQGRIEVGDNHESYLIKAKDTERAEGNRPRNAWWSNGLYPPIIWCRSVQIEKGNFVMDINGGRISADRVESDPSSSEPQQKTPIP